METAESTKPVSAPESKSVSTAPESENPEKQEKQNISAASATEPHKPKDITVEDPAILVESEAKSNASTDEKPREDTEKADSKPTEDEEMISASADRKPSKENEESSTSVDIKSQNDE